MIMLSCYLKVEKVLPTAFDFEGRGGQDVRLVARTPQLVDVDFHLRTASVIAVDEHTARLLSFLS